MVSSPDLFGAEQPAATLPSRWLLASNQMNLCYTLAAGLLMPPSGFGDKYYQDSLAYFPGWIPLFPERIPSAVVEQAVAERAHLSPCVLELDLAGLTGPVVAVSGDGIARECQFPQDLRGDEPVLLVPAPLPTTVIQRILLRSQQDRKALESRVQDYANVPLKHFKLAVQSGKRFPVDPKGHWPPAQLSVTDRPVDLAPSQALGAMQAMLAILAGRGEMGAQLSELVFEGHLEESTALDNPMLAALGEWLRLGRAAQSADVSQRLFWGTVDAVIQCSPAADPRDAVLAHLEATAATLDERLRGAFARLTQDLRALAGLADGTADELFERHPRSFPRALILFFLRERCSGLLDYQHPALTEADILAAALLFAAREGWLGLPLALREQPSLAAAVSWRMAALAQRLSGGGMDLGQPPPRPRTLMALFKPGPRGWTKAQASAALQLAREMKWPGIRTRVRLGKGDYQLLVGGGGVELVLEGEPRAVSSEVEPEEFLAQLADTPIPPRVEQRAREQLKG